MPINRFRQAVILSAAACGSLKFWVSHRHRSADTRANITFAAGNSKPGTTKNGHLYPLKMACDDATALIRGVTFFR